MAPPGDSSTFNAPYWIRCRRTRRRAVGEKSGRERNRRARERGETTLPLPFLSFFLPFLSSRPSLIFSHPSVSASLVVTDASSLLFVLAFSFSVLVLVVSVSVLVNFCLEPHPPTRHPPLHAPSSKQPFRSPPPPTCRIAHIH